ncbi:MAG: hypothetical protein R6X16_05940 [Anaerolineae bacterium]
MRKGLMLALVMVMALVIAGPVWAQGSGPGPMEPPTGEQQGPGAPPEAMPKGPVAPVATPEPVRTQAGEQVQTRTQDQECLQDQECEPKQDRLQDRVGSNDSVDPLMTRQQVRLQICDEECTPEPVGLMTQFRAWVRSRVPAVVQQRLFGVTPFSMSGTAVIVSGELIFDLDNGNRWAEELMDDDTTLITTNAVIKAVYPDGSSTAEIIDMIELEALLGLNPESVVMIFGYVEEDGDFVATRIQIRVL